MIGKTFASPSKIRPQSASEAAAVPEPKVRYFLSTSSHRPQRRICPARSGTFSTSAEQFGQVKDIPEIRRDIGEALPFWQATNVSSLYPPRPACGRADLSLRLNRLCLQYPSSRLLGRVAESGLRHTTRNRARGETLRGFESHPFRQSLVRQKFAPADDAAKVARSSRQSAAGLYQSAFLPRVSRWVKLP